MEEIRVKIRSNSFAVSVGLYFMAVLFIFPGVYSLVGWWTAGDALANSEAVLRGMASVRQILLAALLVYAARIFSRISKEETPFFATLARRIKLGAVLLFLALAVPHWAGYLLSGFGPVFIDEAVILAFLLAAMVFCFAQIIEYGHLVQDENFEIL